MALIDKFKNLKRTYSGVECNPPKNFNEFGALVDEVQREYKEEEICVIMFKPDKGVYIANPGVSKMDCKVLIITKGVYSVPFCFLNNSKSLEMIIMADGVESIQHSAFKDCKKLKFIHFPKTIKNIDDYAFENCIALKDVIFNDYVENLWINENSFSGCKNLEKISIKCGCCRIGGRAFENCENLKSIIVMGNVKMGNSAFKGCKNLNYIKLRYLGDFIYSYQGNCFEDYVREAYNKERQKNYSIGIDAPLEIKEYVNTERKNRNNCINKYQSNFTCDDLER